MNDNQKWMEISGQTKDIPEPFQVSELESEYWVEESGTVAGYDNILPEFLKNMGPKSDGLPHSLYMSCRRKGPLKHGDKPRSLPYLNQARTTPSPPTTNLCRCSVCFKCLERLLLHRIKRTYRELHSCRAGRLQTMTQHWQSGPCTDNIHREWIPA